MKICTLAWSLCSTVLWAQSGALSISGTVVDSQSGQPIPQARVYAECSGASVVKDGRYVPPVGRTAIADVAGAFRFDGVAVGNCYLAASKNGYTQSSGVGSLTGQVELSESKSGIRVPLAKLGVISGVVTDQDRHPLRGVNVILVQRFLEDGIFRTRNSRSVTTADDGAFRLWNLEPGKYYVKAAGQHGTTGLFMGSSTPSNEIFDAFLPAYSDGAHSIGEATPLEVGPASHLKADITLKLESTFAVRGTLQNFTPRKTVKFELLQNGEPPSPVRAVVQMDTGRFELREVSAGSYVVRATQDDKIGDFPLVVGPTDVEGVALTLHPPVSLSYSTRFTTEVPPEERNFRADSCSPRLVSMDTHIISDPRGREELLPGLYPGQYRVILRCAGGYARSALIGNVDLLANPVLTVSPGGSPPPLEIVASRDGASLTVSRGKQAQGALAALLVPQFLAEPLIATDYGNEGFFSFGGIHPGTYSLYLFNSEEIEYRNPQFLQSLTGGERITLTEGQRSEVTFKGTPR